MKITWTKGGIPNGYLNSIPIHLIYRVNGCAPVNQLKHLHSDLKNQLAVLRSFDKENDDERIQQVLAEHFKVYDALLDAQDQSKYILAEEKAAEVVIKSWLHIQEMKLIVLYAVCVMGNHVHVLLRGPDDMPERPLGQLVRRHKTFTNLQIKEVTHTTEDVWDKGFYDRYVRTGKFWIVLDYILKNPVAARLVENWKDWPYTYVDERCLR